jgi:hypothetical protein
MPDELTEEKRKQLVRELADAPQGTRDGQMPPSPNPFGGEVGPDPADDTLPFIDLGSSPGQGAEEHQTGEEAPGGEYAGGVDAADTDGSTRTGT